MGRDNLGLAGRALYDATAADLELDPHEEHLLLLAAHLTDIFSDLMTAVGKEGVIVKSRLGGDVAHPAAKEARAQALAINQLLHSIHVEDEHGETA